MKMREKNDIIKKMCYLMVLNMNLLLILTINEDLVVANTNFLPQKASTLVSNANYASGVW